MASTNQTPNYGLPIYSANDRASWIDTNQAFENIDSAVKEASDNASSAASDVSEALSVANEAKSTATGASSLATQANTLASTANAKADANASNIATLQSTVSQQGTDLDAVEEQAELNRVAIGGVSARMTTAENNITTLNETVSDLVTVKVLGALDANNVLQTFNVAEDSQHYAIVGFMIDNNVSTKPTYLLNHLFDEISFENNTITITRTGAAVYAGQIISVILLKIA